MSQVFGRYTVLGQLGRGAMGVVYLASDPLLNRQVAVKTVDLELDDATEREFLRNRLLRDARAAAVLKHPNIVSVHDVFEEAGHAYVVMEYVDGDTLAASLNANPQPDPAFTLNVLRQMADALDYTHSRGVIHRDVKPANVMIDAAGVAKIMDFGIARISDTRTSTPTGMVMGTIEYMAPEQIRGETVDGHADQFALAVVAYKMMTGSTLFGPQTMATLTYKIVHETPPPPSTRNANLPAAVDGVLAKALAKIPSERFANCREFADALAGAFTATPATVTAPVVPVAATSRRPAVLAVAAVTLCAGGALAVWKPWNRLASPKPDPVAMVQPATTPPPPPSTAQPAIHKPVSAAKTVVAKHVADVPEPVDDAELPTSAPSTKTGETPFDKTMQRGRDLMKNRDYTGAMEIFTRAIALRPRNPMAYYSRGAAHQDLDQNELAVQDYSESIRLAPSLPLAYAGRGVCRVRLHRDEEAMADFQRALELKPDQISALNGRAGVYFRRKEYRLALADYDAAIKSHPGVGRTYLNRARVKEATGDLRGAAADRRAEADLHER